VLFGGSAEVEEPPSEPASADIVEEVHEVETQPEAPAANPDVAEEAPEEVSAEPAPAPVSPRVADPQAPETPEPERVAVAESGTVVVSGDVWSAKLRGADGRIHSPGRQSGDATDGTSRYSWEVPPGTYDLMVSFPDAINISLPGVVKLRAGESVGFRCDKIAQTCR